MRSLCATCLLNNGTGRTTPPCDDKKRRGAVRQSAKWSDVDFQVVTAVLQRVGYIHTRKTANGVEIPETQPLTQAEWTGIFGPGWSKYRSQSENLGSDTLLHANNCSVPWTPHRTRVNVCCPPGPTHPTKRDHGASVQNV